MLLFSFFPQTHRKREKKNEQKKKRCHLFHLKRRGPNWRRDQRNQRKKNIKSATLLHCFTFSLFSPSGGKLKEEKRGGTERTSSSSNNIPGLFVGMPSSHKKKKKERKKRSFFFLFHVTTVSFTIKTLRAQLDKRLGVSPGQVFRISLFLLLVFSCPWWAEKGRERERGRDLEMK